MKRFGLFLLVTMAAAIFTSCNDSDGDYQAFGFRFGKAARK